MRSRSPLYEPRPCVASLVSVIQTSYTRAGEGALLPVVSRSPLSPAPVVAFTGWKKS